MYALQFRLTILLSCPFHRLLAQYTSPSVSSKVLEMRCANYYKNASWHIKEGGNKGTVKKKRKKKCHLLTKWLSHIRAHD